MRDSQLPWTTLERDYFGAPIPNAVHFLLLVDDETLRFAAKQDRSVTTHPDAALGKFQPELWRYDCAELFIVNPETQEYLEINLSANGSWWTCLFKGPRDPIYADNAPLSNITTGANDDVAWFDISLDTLTNEAKIELSKAQANVSFMCRYPEQQFVTFANLPGEEADYHQPTKWLDIEIASL